MVGDDPPLDGGWGGAPRNQTLFHHEQRDPKRTFLGINREARCNARKIQ